jgi:hypothetical protein
VQPADPVARRRAIILVVVATLAGAVLIMMPGLPGGIAAWLVAETATGPTIRLGRLVGAVVLLIALPLAGVGVQLWWMGQRTVAALRFPPPGTKMVQATPILTGEAARRRGRLLQVLSAALVGAAFLLTVLIWAMAGRLPAG